MEKKDNEKNKIGYIIVFLIVFLLICLPILIVLISNNIEVSNQAKREAKLIEEGKTRSADTVINEIIDILKNRDKEKIKSYLADDFIYIDNNNYKSEYIDNFLRDLDYLVTNYDTEKRNNSIKDEETYYIYWNINKMVKERTDELYCLQKIRIYLKRTVGLDDITYKIYKIILIDNR